MAIAKFQFRPGIQKEGTQFAADGGWYDSDKIRWRSGRPEKIGGWQKFSDNTYLGTARALHTWNDLVGTNYMGIGTNLKYYIEEGGAYNDVTPLRATASLSAPFGEINGSATLLISDTAHGAVAGDYVTYSSASTLTGGGIVAATLNAEYQIATIRGADAYEIEASSGTGVADTTTLNGAITAAATSIVLTDGSGFPSSGSIKIDSEYITFTGKSTHTLTGCTRGAYNTNATAYATGVTAYEIVFSGGGSVSAAYQINTGLDTTVPGTGFGSSTWGRGTWGSASAGEKLRLWTQDNFGEDLLLCPRGGGVYYWDATNGVSTRAINTSALSTASNPPTACNLVLVSEIDRHVIAFGVNAIGSSTLDEMFVRWSKIEDAGNWTPATNSDAGGQRLGTGSFIMSAVKARQEILIWTDAAVYSMRYVGGYFTFQFTQVMEGPSMLSPNAAIAAESRVFWMDRGSFWVYDGAVRPLPCTVQDYVFSDINLSQAFKCFAASNPDWFEVMWFYASDSQSGTEIDRYVMYNFRENLWSVGTLERTAWTAAPTRNFPMAAGTADSSNYIYQHETGTDADGSAMTAYIESGDFDFEDGEKFLSISRIIPDLAFSGSADTKSLTVTLKGRNSPGETPATLATSTVSSDTTQAFIRARARQGILRLESTATGVGWRMGDFRMDVRPDGRR